MLKKKVAKNVLKDISWRKDKMDRDIFGEIINGQKTYKYIAMLLNEGQPVIIGWTDEGSTHYDILLALNLYEYGIIQGGLQSDYLYVSIMRKGAFGFRMESNHSDDYIGEKLDVPGKKTRKKLAELINEIIKECNKRKSMDII